MKENILEKNDCIMYELLYLDFVVFHVVCWVFDVVQIFLHNWNNIITELTSVWILAFLILYNLILF